MLVDALLSTSICPTQNLAMEVILRNDTQLIETHLIPKSTLGNNLVVYKLYRRGRG